MKVLIVSDSHGVQGFIKQALENTGKIDVFIHLGDMSGREDVIRSMIPEGVRAYFVRGNNDWHTELPGFEVVRIGKNKAFITHGHRYMVAVYEDILREEAIKNECNIAMYGHTHRPSITNEGGVLVLNPGSISQPRQLDNRPTYIVMELDNTGYPQARIMRL